MIGSTFIFSDFSTYAGTHLSTTFLIQKVKLLQLGGERQCARESQTSQTKSFVELQRFSMDCTNKLGKGGGGSKD